MSIYAIADLHLSFGTNKPMDVFGENWDRHWEKIKNDWFQKVNEQDLVLLPGDFSWATYLEDTYEDFRYLNELPGKKILLKGNHDYWWTTLKSMREYIKSNNFSNIDFLYNNSYLFDNYIISGTKGWQWGDSEEDYRLLRREKLRLFLTFIMGICVLTGCNQFSSTKEHAVKEEQKGEALEEKTDDLSEEQMPEEEESFSTYKEVAALGLPEDMLAYWMVLNNKYPFISTEEGKQEFYWDEYYWCLGYPTGYRQADYITIVDMDGDGANEIVLYCLPESVQILHYEDGVVYSYQDVFRGMKQIHANGIYEGSDGAASTGYYRMTELNRNGYTEEKLASMDGDYREIGGVEVTQEEFGNYVDSIEEIELAENIEFTEDMLDACLLDGLSEEELLIVKHAPIKEMEETEKNDLTEKEEMQVENV